MKKGYVLAMCVALALSMSGCKKKAVEESTDAINLDTLETTSVTPTETASPEAPAVSLDSTSPQGTAAVAPVETATQTTSETPSSKDIQTALKNAGYYSGSVDGKLGPKSKTAIKEFQAANGLTADGKVGAKTWQKLSTYLNAPAAVAEPVR